jgi:hypothetical protein
LGWRWNEGDLERSGGHHDLAGTQDLVVGADLEAICQLLEAGDPVVEAGGQVERLRVGLQVVGDRILGRVGVGRGKKRHAGQGVVLGRVNSFQRIPAGPPDVPELGGGLQDHKAQDTPCQVPGHGQACLATPTTTTSSGGPPEVSFWLRGCSAVIGPLGPDPTDVILMLVRQHHRRHLGEVHAERLGVIDQGRLGSAKQIQAGSGPAGMW